MDGFKAIRDGHYLYVSNEKKTDFFVMMKGRQITLGYVLTLRMQKSDCTGMKWKRNRQQSDIDLTRIPLYFLTIS